MKLRSDLIAPLLMLLPLILGSVTEARKDAKNRVDTWDLKSICTTNEDWPPELQKALLAELKQLPKTSLINSRLKVDWARMRKGNRICAGEEQPK